VSSRTARPARSVGDVGGRLHTGRMETYEMCERCFGTGADPRQPFAQAPDEIAFCIECFGEGCVPLVLDAGAELAHAG
jgi:hypothetical protein